MNKNEFIAVEKENDEIEIDLALLCKRLLKYWKLIVISALICGLLSFVISAFFITEQFDSTGRIYIKPENADTGNVDSMTIDVTNKMVNNYIYMIKGDTVIEKVSKQMDGELKPDKIKKIFQ